MSDGGADWTTAELVRSVIALTESIRDLKATIDDLDDKFVLRAVHDVELANVRQTQRTHGDTLDQIEQKAIPGLHERINRVKDSSVARSTVWQVVGLCVGLLAIASSLLAVILSHRK